MVADIKVGDKLSKDDPMWISFTTGKKLEQTTRKVIDRMQ